MARPRPRLPEPNPSIRWNDVLRPIRLAHSRLSTFCVYGMLSHSGAADHYREDCLHAVQGDTAHSMSQGGTMLLSAAVVA